MTPTLTLHHPETARRYYAEGVWAEDTRSRSGLRSGTAAAG